MLTLLYHPIVGRFRFGSFDKLRLRFENKNKKDKRARKAVAGQPFLAEKRGKTDPKTFQDSDFDVSAGPKSS